MVAPVLYMQQGIFTGSLEPFGKTHLIIFLGV